MKKLRFEKKLLPAAIGGGILVLLGVLNLLWPKEEYSSTRNESLQSLPSLSLSGLLSGSVQETTEQSLSEHFLLRDVSAPLSNRISAYLGLGQVDDVYLLSDRQIEAVSSTTQTEKASQTALETLFSQYRTCFLGLIPSAAHIYRDQLYADPELLDEGALMSLMYQNLDKSRTIDLDSVLSSGSENDIYYTTDNRLTGYGAYLVYQSVSKALGLSPLGMESFNIRHAKNGVYGNLYQRTMIRTGSGDTLDEYQAKSGAVVQSLRLEYTDHTVETDSLYLEEALSSGDAMDFYLGSGWGMAEIRTDSTADTSLLMITSEDTNTVLPFLALHYPRVTVVHPEDASAAQLESVNPDDYTSTLLLFPAADAEDGTAFAGWIRELYRD